MALIKKRSMKETISITRAIAVASEYWYCSSFVMMSKGDISVDIGILPEMKTTDPYSPRERAKDKVKPVSKAGRMFGKITAVKVLSRPAPKLAAASSNSGSKS